MSSAFVLTVVHRSEMALTKFNSTDTGAHFENYFFFPRRGRWNSNFPCLQFCHFDRRLRIQIIRKVLNKRSDKISGVQKTQPVKSSISRQDGDKKTEVEFQMFFVCKRISLWITIKKSVCVKKETKMRPGRNVNVNPKYVKENAIPDIKVPYK